MKKLLKLFAIFGFAIWAFCPALAENNPANIPAVASIAVMQALGTAAPFYPTVFVLGNSGGTFHWTSGSCTADGGVYIQANGVSTSTGCYVRQGDIKNVSPYWWGAHVDGVSDDNTYYQAAVNYLAANGCGTVVIPSGVSIMNYVNYVQQNGTINGVVSIQAKSCVSMMGEGPSSILRLKPNLFGPGAFYGMIRGADDGIGLQNVTFSNFSLDGNSPNETASTQNNGISVVSRNNVTIENINAYNTGGSSLQQTGYSYPETGDTLTASTTSGSNVIYPTWNGVAGYPPGIVAGSRITGSNIPAGTTIGTVGGCTPACLQLTANATSTSGSVTIGVIAPTQNAKFVHNTVTNPSFIGIQASQFLGLVINDNTVKGAVNNCIDVYSDNGTTIPTGGNFVINGNSLDHCLEGIFPETSSNGSITGNTVTNSSSAVWINQIFGIPRTITVTGNTSSNNGICYHAGGNGQSGLIFNDNNCDNFTTAGLDFSGSGIVAKNNLFTNSTAPDYTLANMHYSDISNNRSENASGIFTITGTNGNIHVTQPVDMTAGLNGVTFGSLPTCGTFQAGDAYVITDSTTTTFNATASGGGSLTVTVVCNGNGYAIGGGANH